MSHTHTRRSGFIRFAAALIALILIGCGLYLADYYPCDKEAIAAFSPASTVSVQNLDDAIAYIPNSPSAGLVFYPGGKVEHTAYEPLMKAFAQQGLLCVLAEMPFRLAVFDINAASGIPEQFPHIDRWYIGGHSLGGSMAASHLSKHQDIYDGLILLGSYSTADISGSDLKVLSVYGSEDLVLSRQSYDKYRSNLPENFTELIIDGGCHAYFGMYGQQDGDGTPTISNTEQILQTANAVAALIAE